MVKYADIRNGLRSRIAVLTRLISLTLCVPMTRATPDDSVCGFKELQQCARPLRVLASAQDLLFVRDLDMACQDLQAGLRCVHRYARMCMSHSQAEHLARLYRGTQATVRELCTADGPYRLDFLRHARCTVKASSKYGECTHKFQHVIDNLENVRVAEDSHMKIIAADVNKRRDMQMRKQMVIDKVDIHVPTYAPLRNAAGKQVRSSSNLNNQMKPQNPIVDREAEIERLRPLCCAFKRLDACAFDAMRSTCGSDTAYFVSDFLRGMSANAMRMHCALFEEENGPLAQTCDDDIVEEPVLLEVKMQNSAPQTFVQSTWLGIIVAVLVLSLG